MGRNMPAAGKKIKLVKISQGKTTKTAAAGKKKFSCGLNAVFLEGKESFL